MRCLQKNEFDLTLYMFKLLAYWLYLADMCSVTEGMFYSLAVNLIDPVQ